MKARMEMRSSGEVLAVGGEAADEAPAADSAGEVGTGLAEDGEAAGGVVGGGIREIWRPQRSCGGADAGPRCKALLATVTGRRAKIRGANDADAGGER
jgi:hypothetical protein